MFRPHIVLALVACAFGLMAAPRLAPGARAQEVLQVGLSTNRIDITSDFRGTDLVVFGGVGIVDDPGLRNGRYDIVVAMEGPRQPVVVRRKAPVLGIWLNRGSEAFEAAPSSYVLASTQNLADTADDATLKYLALGTQFLRLSPPDRTQPRDAYADALLGIKDKSGLYLQAFSTVRFVGPALFRANLNLPAALPVGQHMVHVFLFRNGFFLAESSVPLQVAKTGYEALIQHYATDYGALYGIFAVLLAVLTGWLGRIAFKRD